MWWLHLIDLIRVDDFYKKLQEIYKQDFTLQKNYFITIINLSGRDNTLTCFQFSRSPEKQGFGITVTPSSTTELKNCTLLLEIQLFYFKIPSELLWIPVNLSNLSVLNLPISVVTSWFLQLQTNAFHMSPSKTTTWESTEFPIAFLSSLSYSSHQLSYRHMSCIFSPSYVGKKTS